MLRQTRLHHGLRNELKDSAGWSCLDSQGDCGISHGSARAPAGSPLFLRTGCSGSICGYCLLGGRTCLKITSYSREDKVRVVHMVHTSLAAPSGFVGFLRSKRITLVPLPSTEAQRSFSDGRQVSGSGSLP